MKTIIKHCSHHLLIFFLIILPGSLMAFDQANPETGAAKEIQTIIAAEQNPYLMRSGFPNRVEDMASLYRLSGNQLLWLGNENAEKNINDALELLANAEFNGLNPANYDIDVLRQKLASTLSLDTGAYLQMALYDTALSIAVLRFCHDLHYGMVDPKKVNFNLKLRAKKNLDLPMLIKNSIASGTVTQLPNLVEPKHKQYSKLKQSLAKYIELSKSAPIKLFIRKSLRIGNENPQLPELQRFLIALGDLADQKPVADTTLPIRYNKDMADGIKKFQKRHGLPETGVLDKSTASEINVPLDQRVTQIKLAMERLRWLPEFNPGQAVIVNIPAFQLWAFDDIDAEHPNILNINVLVGKAPKNQTPVLMADMQYINFLPYWNVPSTILKKEILPKLTRGSNFLARQNMEVVSNYGNSGKPVALSASAMEKLRRGVFRIRQRPGKGNALGKIKFIFPNKDDVYLHDTPAKALFKKTRRDFSHGCIRVETPEKLAEFVFQNQKGWDKEAIRKAMRNSKMQEVILDKPIPVVLFYSTSFINENDELMFYPDIYYRDPPLLAALSKPDDLSDKTLFKPLEKIEAKAEEAIAPEAKDTQSTELMQ